jgi:hypothetical protein
MADDPDYILEVKGLDADDAAMSGGGSGRPWIGVRFECCGVYVRIYRNVGATAYEGRCPRCLRRVRATVGPEGTSCRFFSAE